jgi:hypothetical protein
MLSKKKGEKIYEGWTLESPATPDLVAKYISVCRLGDDDTFTRAARDYTYEKIMNYTRLCLELDHRRPTIHTIAERAIYSVEAFVDGASFVIVKLDKEVLNK